MFRSTSGIGYGNPDDRQKIRLEFRITPKRVLHVNDPLADLGLMHIGEHAKKALCRHLIHSA